MTQLDLTRFLSSLFVALMLALGGANWLQLPGEIVLHADDDYPTLQQVCPEPGRADGAAVGCTRQGKAASKRF